MARSMAESATLVLLVVALCAFSANGRDLKQTTVTILSPRTETLPSLQGPSFALNVNNGRAKVNWQTPGLEYQREIDMGGVDIRGDRPAFFTTRAWTAGLFVGRKLMDIGRNLKQTTVTILSPRTETLPSLQGPSFALNVNNGRAKVNWQTPGLEYQREIDMGGVDIRGDRPAFFTTRAWTAGLFVGRKLMGIGRNLKQTTVTILSPRTETLPSLQGPSFALNVNNGRAKVNWQTPGLEYQREIDMGGVDIRGDRPAFFTTRAWTAGLFVGRKKQ